MLPLYKTLVSVRPHLEYSIQALDAIFKDGYWAAGTSADMDCIIDTFFERHALWMMMMMMQTKLSNALTRGHSLNLVKPSCHLSDICIFSYELLTLGIV